MTPFIQSFYDVVTGSVSYVVYDLPGGHAAVIDPVLGFDLGSGRTDPSGADRIVHFIAERQLTLDWILETHAHADRLSAAGYLQGKLGGQIATGKRIHEVQTIFKRVFNLEGLVGVKGTDFDYRFQDHEVFRVGALTGQVIPVPGHTPSDVAYLFDVVAFVGDTVLMPDLGTVRCDFPGGSASQLFHSIGKLLALPAQTQLMLCHDYPPEGREPKWQVTVAEQIATNIHVRSGITEKEFVALREARDKTLGLPRLFIPAMQVNIRAGHLPPAELDGKRYLKWPLDVL